MKGLYVQTNQGRAKMTAFRIFHQEQLLSFESGVPVKHCILSTGNLRHFCIRLQHNNTLRALLYVIKYRTSAHDQALI